MNLAEWSISTSGPEGYVAQSSLPSRATESLRQPAVNCWAVRRGYYDPVVQPLRAPLPQILTAEWLQPPAEGQHVQRGRHQLFLPFLPMRRSRCSTPASRSRFCRWSAQREVPYAMSSAGRLGGADQVSGLFSTSHPHSMRAPRCRQGSDLRPIPHLG